MGKTTRASGNLINPNCVPKTKNPNGYKSFLEFYDFYLGEHSNQTNRRLHIVGTTISLILLICGIISGSYVKFLGLGLIQGYGFAWVGHFFFEQNKPATFQHPFYSFISDFKLLSEVYTGKRQF